MKASILVKKNKNFFIEDVHVDSIIEKFATPSYIYSKQRITDNFKNFEAAFKDIKHLICFAVKANSNLAILNLLAKNGAGFDIVSGGELRRVLAAKGDPRKIVFSGVGKTSEEIKLAIETNILAFNIESEDELSRIQEIAKSLNKKASISIRVNPNVDANTHPYISTGLKENKFGVSEACAFDLYKRAKKFDSISIEGIDCHIGSQITDLKPFEDSIRKLIALVDKLELEGIKIKHMDIGGGIGVSYEDEKTIAFNEYAKVVATLTKDRDIKILLEPGRAIMADAGVIMTKVEYVKKDQVKNFAIIDAAMNDLMRPSLYGAFHKILNVSDTTEKKLNFDIVGPICETGDFIGKDRMMSIEPNNILVILDAGAYAMSMSSNYNSRPRLYELMIDKDKIHVIREKESFDDLIKGERLLLES
ncbi:MAG: diaminopimelate decarboxylase [Nitrosomonadales bacterium]|jgi:diaminopimelate decarboxylase|nr:diaminopimelate decarboxylase [Nitrosomonadales bacterium]MBT5149915.1 diaminopimelate decarboxylase [Nitrosomonadales bacterium]MBT5573086.1 diaminopimelate decarboxylase [Nitrosomonadales bacterium]MBT6250460.1 diaminopimelate decarboxylase [Nitrosomonadales bacterium]MBT7689600.1 diaminopimelate decarboxylase [Nitrosomonadales bacterium]